MIKNIIKNNFFIWLTLLLLDVFGSVAFATVTAKNAPQPNQKKDIVFGVLSGDLVQYKVADVFCAMINQRSDVRCLIKGFPTVADGIEDILHNNADFFFLPSNVPNELMKNEKLDEKYKQSIMQIRALFAVYSEAFTLIKLNSDKTIHAFNDLIKHDNIIGVNLNDPGDTAALNDLLSLGNEASKPKVATFITEDDMMSGLCNGKVNALFLTTPHPNSFVHKLSNMCRVDFIDIDPESFKGSKYYIKASIPSRLYNKIKKGKGSGLVRTIGTTVELCAGPHVKDELVNRVVETVMNNMEYVYTSSPVFLSLTFRKMLDETSLPRHRIVSLWIEKNKAKLSRGSRKKDGQALEPKTAEK